MAAGTILEGTKGTYKINISINAQADIEDVLNTTMLDVLNGEPSIKNYRIIFAIGLRYGENKKFNFSEAGDIIDDIIAKHNYEYFQDKVIEEFKRAYGNADEDSKSEKESTGK